MHNELLLSLSLNENFIFGTFSFWLTYFVLRATSNTIVARPPVSEVSKKQEPYNIEQGKQQIYFEGGLKTK